MRNRIPTRWAAVAFGFGLLTASTPARADDLGKLADLLVVVVVFFGLTVLGALINLGIFIAASVLGQRGAPVAPWKRTLAVLGIVFGALTSVWNALACFVIIALMDPIATQPSSNPIAVFGTLALGVLPLASSICAIIWSAKLYGRNRDAGRTR